MKAVVALVLVFHLCLGVPTDEETKTVSTFAGKETSTDKPDVYWKTWRGKAPEDAVIVGETMHESGIMIPVYLGQTFITNEKGSIQPVGMFSHSKTVKPTYGSQIIYTNRHIEVLCSEDQDIFTWVPISETHNLRGDEDCVVGGYELDFNLYYGRSKFEDNTVYGKAILNRKVMYFPYQGKEKKIWDYEGFEVLCYKDAVERKKLEFPESNKGTDNAEEDDSDIKIEIKPGVFIPINSLPKRPASIYPL